MEFYYYILLFLRLSNNFIEEIHDDSFGDLHELIGLDLSSNLIEVISFNAFVKLRNLLWLKIDQNCLLNVALYLPVRALHSLNIAHNLINEFPQISGSISITMLNLSHNKIVDLEIEFASMKALSKSIQSLDISGNQMRHPNQLLAFVNLVELNLASNVNIDFTTNEKFIRHLAALKKLNLTNTNLTSLDVFLHVDGSHFTELSLMKNPLLSINFEDLKKFSNLIHLEFRQKTCYSFDSYRDIKRNFRNLRSVKISYDESNCKCIKWNKMQFEFESIDFITDWDVCDNDPDCGKSMKIDFIVMTLFAALIVIL